MRVALGVTGCIAAYKAVEVMRLLQKSGVTVQVLMTRHATEFVGPLTFQAISGLPVITDMFAPTEDPEIRHIEVAQQADLLLVAPATANVLARFANGIADDFLSTVYISTTAPVLVAPAMNVEMWAHPATQENVERLRRRGVHFIDPGEGYLACKTVGAGRLAEPQEIAARALAILAERPAPPPRESERDRIRAEIEKLKSGLRSELASLQTTVAAEVSDMLGGLGGIRGENEGAPSAGDLAGERLLITAGPTYEAIDPVRGITNRSSGRMGYAIAAAALKRGAAVTLVSGPVALPLPDGAQTIRVRSAAEMLEAVMGSLEPATIVVMAAAVADYRPARAAEQKIKKQDGRLTLELEPTADILATVGPIKGERVLVGFAAESENVVANARKKLLAKGADLIVANDISAADAGFDVETNRVTLVTAEGDMELPLMSKREVADRVLDAALRARAARASR